MAMVRVNGMMYPGPSTWTPSSFTTAAVIDATGEKYAWIGQVRWFDGSASKNLRKFHFFPATVVSAGGSGMTLSIQNVSATGNPPQPDGVADQSVNFNINTLTTSTWFVSPALGADRTVSPGDLIAVVLEFDGGGVLGADAVNINRASANGSVIPIWGGASLFSGAAWTGQGTQSACMLEFSDGTFGQLGNSMPLSNFAATNYNTGSAADEFALRFQVPFDCYVDGCYVVANQQAAGRNISVNLYDGSTNLLTSLTIDAEYSVLALNRYDVNFPAEVALSRNQTYYLSVKALSASNISVQQFSLQSSSYLGSIDGGAELYQATRKGGAWSTDQTVRPNFGIRISQIGDGTASAVQPPVFRLEGVASARY